MRGELCVDDYITLNLKQIDVMGSRERDALRGEVATSR